MQMLQAGGIPILTDGIRQPDQDNPRGYMEWEPVKMLRSGSDWLESATGHAVKMVHLLLPELPTHLQYRILFMRREMSEILASQQAMLDRLGKKGSGISPEELAKAYQAQIERVMNWLSASANIRVQEVSYADLVTDAEPVILAIQTFLGCELDQTAMRAAVDPNLYRNRVPRNPTSQPPGQLNG